MSRPVHLEVIVLTDDENLDAKYRIESTVRRALGQWLDPARVYVELARETVPQEDQ